MYRGRPWTMRQYAGFGSAAETNARFRYLLDHGQTGLSVAFDLPTQMGYDRPPDGRRRGRQGRGGHRLLADMRRLFEGIPLDQVSTSMTINAPAAVLLLLYQLVGEEQGVDLAALTGTVQNDVLKEYIARGTYIYPPAPPLRITTDLFAYCAEQLPRFNTISISGYHMAEAGATAVQEIAFTPPTPSPMCRRRWTPGWPDAFAPRLAFFFVARTTLFGGGGQVPGGPPHLGRHHGHPVRGRGAALADAALPHPDGRGPAHRPAAAQQRRPGGRAGPGGRARRHPVAAHQRLRRGPRPVEEAAACLAPRTPAGAGQRDRGHRHGRPAGRVVLRGYPTDEVEAAARQLMAWSRNWAAPSPPSSAASRSRRSSARPTTSSARSSRATGWWSASTATPGGEEEPVTIM